jgi:uncharacterized protein involved in exopolysaccharide biosynthesis
MSDSSNDIFTISRVLGILRGHKRLATMVFLGVLAGATTIVMSLPDVYRATATVLVEHPGTSEVGRAPMAVELETRLQMIEQEVLSQTHLRAFVNRLNLYRELGGRGANTAVERLRRDVQVKLTRSDAGRRATVAFSISVRWRDPETAARVANALADIYIEENAKIRARQGSAARLTRLGQELAQMQEAYTARYPDVLRLKSEIAALGHDGAKPSPAVGEEFRILDLAVAARGPVAPLRSRLFLLAIGLALGAAGAAVILAELLQPSFHSPEELHAFTTIPLLASIPFIPSSTDSQRLWPTAARIAVGLALVVFVSYHLAKGNDQLVSLLSRSAAP